ncbi:MAG: retroviral-like aspartic protease family protein [Thermoplasmatales archaeon]|nr:retroviral-like aspartic protease family protein [Thermoplasmatales archaeon]
MGRIYRPIQLRNNGRKVDVVAFVDTGADKSVISERVAKKLKLKFKRRDKLVVANREVITAYVDKVRVVSTKDNINIMMYVDITDVPFDIDIDDIDMIIGIDFLQKHNVKLSFKKRR